REIRKVSLEQALVLRRSLLGSAAIVLGALVLAVLVHVTLRACGIHITQFTRTVMGILSLAFFVIATLGRVGWPRRSYEEATTMGWIDECIYRYCYAAGTTLGVLATLP